MSLRARLGRTHPDLPPETACQDVDLAILTDVARMRNWPPSGLGTAFLLAASLGGYVNRPNDPPPGTETTGYGQSALSFAAWIIGLSRDLGAELKRLMQCCPERGTGATESDESCHGASNSSNPIAEAGYVDGIRRSGPGIRVHNRLEQR